MSARRSKSSQPQQTGLPKIDSHRLEELGEALRKRYEDIESEPIPERLKLLIEQLKDSDRNQDSGD